MRSRYLQLGMVFLLCLGSQLRAQLIEPASWSFALSEASWAAGTELELRFRAKVDEGWYMYASDFSPDLGPLRAELRLVEDASYTRLGELQSPGRKEGYDSIWGGNYTYFTEVAQFVQPIRVEKMPLRFSGSLQYQLCSKATGRCVLFEEEFNVQQFALGDAPSSATKEEKKATNATVNANATSAIANLWGFFLVAFLAGLAALFTPCVFPLIPMTVTYFTENTQHGRSKAVFYGLFIVVIYTLIGFVIAPFMGPELANELATGWLPNVIFFTIFVLFGLSFLGMFEITLPYKWANFAEGKTEGKGIFGVFFMALTLVLVTFSCTGPLVGSILVESVGGLKMKPVFGMLGYSLAFALPFSFFALFPKWLKALPKSGGWLNTVKVTLGFLELAFALKFLSVADQAYHWGVLDREIYISLWVVIFGLLGLYLLGKLRLPKDSPQLHLGVPRMMVAILVLSFVVYLIPGMFGAPLKALAGYLPPQSSHDFDLGAFRYNSASVDEEAPCGPPLYGEFLHFPHQLQGYFDYEQAIACARSQNKPLFVDFTGHGCVNCREMEARVWADERVLRRLREDYVLVALYIDERSELSKEKWYVSAYDGKQKKTIGKQNADLQITRFQNNAQPYYVLLGRDEELLVSPRAYDLSVQSFVDFLDRAKAAYAAKYNKTQKTEEKKLKYNPFENL